MRNLKDLKIGRRGIVMDPHSGESFRLNDTAKVILTQLQCEKSPQEIAKLLSDDFNVGYDSALSDVYEFCANLSIQGIST